MDGHLERLAALESRRKTLIRRSFVRLHPGALGVAVGCVFALGLFLATVVLVVKGGRQTGVNLQVLNNYFPGYSVTLPGAFVGMGYAACTGLAFGFLLAWFRNLALSLVLKRARWQANRWRRRHLLDEI